MSSFRLGFKQKYQQIEYVLKIFIFLQVQRLKSFTIDSYQLVLCFLLNLQQFVRHHDIGRSLIDKSSCNHPKGYLGTEKR